MTITSAEAAVEFGVSEGTLRQWVMRGDLEPVRRGARPLRFWPEDVAAVQHSKRSKTWRARHAEAAARWERLQAGA